MQSSDESFQRLISAKRCELLDEKRRLGLSSVAEPEKATRSPDGPLKTVRVVEPPPRSQHVTRESQSAPNTPALRAETGDVVPPELLRYMRRYSGLPPMLLKTGEFSPNNPLFSERPPHPADRSSVDAFPGLGAYGERRERLRALRRREYREYLDQQAKKRSEPARGERATRGDLALSGVAAAAASAREPTPRRLVEAGTQCERAPAPCVAVQTDGGELSAISANANSSLTQAERELSPRTVQEPYDERSEQTYPARPNNQTSNGDAYARRPSNGEIHGRGPPEETRSDRPSADDRPIKPNLWTEQKNGSCLFLRSGEGEREKEREFGFRRRSYDHARTESAWAAAEAADRPKLRDLRHTYLPSFLDAELIRQRNLKAHQEAQERRRFYQQELKSQIQEQQRIREERKAREKLLEEAEMRRLEGQLRVLRRARDDEAERAARLGGEIHENGVEYNRQRNLLQRDIESERAQAFRSYSQPLPARKHPEVKTSKSDNTNLKRPSKLPFYYQSTQDLEENADKSNRQPFSSNISDESLFSPNYDVENYLRRNLNPEKNPRENQFTYPDRTRTKSGYVPSFLRTDIGDLIVRDNVSQDSLPIPVLRHSPKNANDLSNSEDRVEANGVSDAMKLVENKWQVPIVQKNILRALPSGDGTSKNILTQLGSIRRQLQLEQLKLDEMLRRDPVAK